MSNGGAVFLQPAEQVRVHSVLAEWCLNPANALDKPYRLWLVLKALDTAGRGYLAYLDVLLTLTSPESPAYLAPVAELNEWLAAGEGLFWISGRAKGRPDGEHRLFLYSPAKVRRTLDCPYVEEYREVMYPTEAVMSLGVADE